MGYTTRVWGEFTITPPLTWNEIKTGPFDSLDSRKLYIADGLDLALRIDEDTVDTDDGPLHRRTATALVMREIDEYRERGLVDQVQRIVDAFPGHTWSGRLDGEGDENLDVWRVLIRDGQAVRIKPRITWPDEEEADR